MTGVVRQASCVALNGRGVLIEGPPGSGKSSLALALIDRGARLVGDDAVTMEVRRGELWASPAPNIAGKLEIRNVGIVDLPAAEAPVALILALDTHARRHIDRPDMATIEGCDLPLVQLWPDSPVLALRAEWALRLYGKR